MKAKLLFFMLFVMPILTLSYLTSAFTVDVSADVGHPVWTYWQRTGMLSQYEFGPWYGTVKYNQGLQIAKLPNDEVMAGYDGTIAMSNCAVIGWHGEMQVFENGNLIDTLEVIVFDCAGKDAIQANGETWMDNDGYAAEMGWNLRLEHPEWYRNPNINTVITVWPREMEMVQ